MDGWRRHALAMAALVLALGAIEIAFGERIGINGGQGWDGQAYMFWSIDFWHRVIEQGVSHSAAQRVLPSAIVYYAGNALGVAPTLPHHIIAFAILDLVELVAAAIVWAHLAFAVMRWPRAACWAGFVALFASFANARHALYYPVLTDSSAFLLGMVMTWGYLARKPVAVAVVAAIAAWTWPPLWVIAMAMLVLRRPPGEIAPFARVRLARWIAGAVAGALAIAFLLIARRYYVRPVEGIACEKFTVWVRADLLWLTVPLVAIQLGVGGYLVASQPRLWNVSAYRRALSWRATALAIATCLAIIGLYSWWDATVATQPGGGSFDKQFVCEHSNAALRGPLWGLVHHVVYFGPIVIVAVAAWRRVAALAAAWGPGAAVATGMIVAFSVGSQSRQWIHLLPLLVALAIAATAQAWTPARLVGFAVLALAWSKLWFHIGYVDVHHWFDDPDQRYYMHLGQWATDRSYYIHGACAAITAIPIVLVLARRRGTDRSAPPS